MYKRRISRVFIFIFLASILALTFYPGRALGWSAVNAISACHSKIDGYAYEILSADPAFKNVKFPGITEIQDNDYVTISRTGTGPDVPGFTKGGDHYYNPRLEGQPGQYAGGGPDAVFDQFTKLVYAYNSGDPKQAAHAASWAAHFAADLCTPYHTQGMSREAIQKIYDEAGGKDALWVILPSTVTGPLNLSGPILSHDYDNFVWEARRFLETTENSPHRDMEDWFDPWYWDGIGDPVIESSHVVFEGLTHVFPGTVWSFLTSLDTSGGATNYSSMWRNPVPSFSDPVGRQASQVREFAKNEARVTQALVDGSDFSVSSIFSDATPYLKGAIESAATVWRASFSALSPGITVTVPDKNNPKKLKVVGTVANMAGETVLNVKIKATVTGGTIKSGDKEPSLDSIEVNAQESYTWEVEAAQLGYCTFKMEVIGQYNDTPDLQYAATSVTAPGIIPMGSATGPASRDHSIVFCLDNSSSMEGAPIIDAMDAGVQAVDAAKYAGVEMAVYFFGTYGCDPPIRVVDFTLNREEVKAAIQTASARGKTPLAAAITAAGEYVRSSANGQEATIILLTDGMETCGGDPVAAARALNPSINLSSRSLFVKPAYAANNIPIHLQVVGFNIQSGDSEAYLAQVAQAGNGKYYSAANLQQLVAALTTVVEEATGKGGGIPVWWYISGGAVLLLVLILLLRRGRRAPVPVNAMAGIPSVQAPYRPPGYPSGSGFFCPACGSMVPAGASFCTECGGAIALTSPAAVTTAGGLNCPRCGFQNTAGSAFCGKCGSPVNAQELAYCTQCGAPAVTRSAFCNKCGRSLAVKAAPPPVRAVQTDRLYCPQCGAPNSIGSGFCNKCGSSLVPAAPVRPPVPRQTGAAPVKAPSPSWWFLPFFLGIIGGMIAWLALKDRNPDMARRLLILSVAWTFLLMVSFVVSNLA